MCPLTPLATDMQRCAGARGIRHAVRHAHRYALTTARVGVLIASKPRQSSPGDLLRARASITGPTSAGTHMGCSFAIVMYPSYSTTGLSSVFALASLTASSGYARRLQHTLPISQPSESATPPSTVWRVAVVGRANVGKSSLCNRFITASSSASRGTRQQLAIVGPEPGTTRDRKETLCSCGSMNLLVVDTSGVDEEHGYGDCALLQQTNEQVTSKATVLVRQGQAEDSNLEVDH